MPIDRDTRALLDTLRIASPCDAPWSAMAGDDRVRHCAQCDRKVYNTANLRAEEVAALFQPGQPLPCLQLWRRADGTVITSDCPVGARRLRSRRRTPVAIALTTLLAACTPASLRTTGLVGSPPPQRTGGTPVAIDPGCAPTGTAAHPEPAHPLTGKVSAPALPVMGEVAVAPTPKGEPPAR